MKNNSAGLSLVVSSSITYQADPEHEACVRFLAAIIIAAAQDACQGQTTGIRFFTDTKSRFWEMCNVLNIDSKSIADKVLKGFIKCPSRLSRQTYCVDGNVPLPN
jgi:hypothetical protein